MLKGINHITIAVSELEKALQFYVGLLGFKLRARWDSGAYLLLGGIWLCLSKGTVVPSNDYSHIAFDIEASDFDQFAAGLRQAGVREWKRNKSEGPSLYLLDPDGNKLEIHTGNLESRIASLRDRPYDGLQIFE
jgi:catechol 2,3-dioxygenase-like lactoylglutathione lyase family enzyme